MPSCRSIFFQSLEAFFEKSKVACPELYEKIYTTLVFQYICSVNLKLQPGHGYVRLTQRLKIRGNITCLLNLCKKKKKKSLKTN